MPNPVHTSTTSQLLEALLDRDQDRVWIEFDSRYRPIISGLARRLGLSEEDAEEAAQQTLTDFVEHYRAGGYDRRKGRLRSWILGIARHRIADLQRSRRRRRERRGRSALDALPNEDRLTEIWENERERAILSRAIRELPAATKADSRTIRAFELTILEEMAPETVADQCDMTVDEVYVAKHRVTNSLRQIVARLEKVYSED